MWTETGLAVFEVCVYNGWNLCMCECVTLCRIHVLVCVLAFDIFL